MDSDVPSDSIKHRRRETIKALHPDVGGDSIEFVAAMAAFEQPPQSTDSIVFRPRRKRIKMLRRMCRSMCRRRHTTLS